MWVSAGHKTWTYNTEISKLISTILTKNNFSFNGEYYLQTQGTAMGTKMAPSYANIFMGEIERQFLDTQDYKPLVWWRYNNKKTFSIKTDFYWWLYDGIILVFLQSTKTYSHYSEKNTVETRIIKKHFQ